MRTPAVGVSKGQHCSFHRKPFCLGASGFKDAEREIPDENVSTAYVINTKDLVLTVVLRTADFWGHNGRVGVITQGDWTNRLILVYPDTPETWAFVASSSPAEEDVDVYPLNDQAADEVTTELGIVWLARSAEEERLEGLVFGLRKHFSEDNSIRGMLRQGLKKILGRA